MDFKCIGHEKSTGEAVLLCSQGAVPQEMGNYSLRLWAQRMSAMTR
jgi:hypothetical protein